jgi:hypothetical protein
MIDALGGNFAKYEQRRTSHNRREMVWVTRTGDAEVQRGQSKHQRNLVDPNPSEASQVGDMGVRVARGAVLDVYRADRPR